MLKRLVAIALLLASPFVGVQAGSAMHATQNGDYCPKGTWMVENYRIECEQDHSCDAIAVKLDEGECWWTTRP